MKNNIYYVLLALICFTCTDESTFNNPVHNDLENGAFVRFTTAKPSLTFLDAQAINFSDEIYDANNNTSNYRLELKAIVSGITYVVEDYFETQSFPTNMTITSQNIADAINVDVSTFDYGDSFEFIAFATRTDGVVFNGVPTSFDDDNLTTGHGNTEPNLLNAVAYKSAMNFKIIVACPFVQSEMIGTYTVVNDDWADYAPGDQVTIIAGVESDTYIILADTNPYITNAGSATIVVTVDPISGASTGESSEAYMYAGWNTVDVTANEGLTLSCVGLVSLNVNFWLTPTSGWFDYNLTLQKN